jgi:hypothetical protein
MGPRQPRRYGQVWRPCGPIASASRPTPGRGRCAARGPHRGSPWAGRGGRRDQQGGGVGTWGGAGRQPARQPASSIPDGWCWAANRWPQYRPGPGRHPARAIRQAAWQRPQGRQRRPGQARQGQPRQEQGQGQVGRPDGFRPATSMRSATATSRSTRPAPIGSTSTSRPTRRPCFLSYRQQSQWRHIAAGRLLAPGAASPGSPSASSIASSSHSHISTGTHRCGGRPPLDPCRARAADLKGT